MTCSLPSSTARVGRAGRMCGAFGTGSRRGTMFKVEGIELEGFDDVGVDVQYPWESSPRRFHEQQLEMKPFYIDKYPVTNAEFKQFLVATGYRPPDALNFLRDWKEGTYPAGWDRKPVTWV